MADHNESDIPVPEGTPAPGTRSSVEKPLQNDASARMLAAAGFEKPAEQSETIPLREVLYLHVDVSDVTKTIALALSQIGITKGEFATSVDAACEKLKAAAEAGTPVSLMIVGKQINQSGTLQGPTLLNLAKELQKIRSNPDKAKSLQTLRTIILFSSTGTIEDVHALQELLPGCTIESIRKPAKLPVLLKRTVLALKTSGTIADSESEQTIGMINVAHPET